MASLGSLSRVVLLAASIVTRAVSWQCYSDIDLGPVELPDRKGLAIDDFTLRWCAQRTPQTWPNVDNTTVSYIRLFKAWDPLWEEDGREASWNGLKEFVTANNAKVLVGTPVSCSEEDDDLFWKWTKDLMQLLGPEHIMGLGIGNELELLQFKNKTIVPDECVEEIWENGYLWRRFTSTVEELDRMGPGFESIPVTSVFTGTAFAGCQCPGQPFLEVPQKARVNTFLRNATNTYGFRFVFVWNLYPYFDPGAWTDAPGGDTCNGALASKACWGPACSVPEQARYGRWLMSLLTGHVNYTMWIGETGWSYPKSETLSTAVENCVDWSSEETFRSFYQGFLSWDLNVNNGNPADGTWLPPDVVFWFTTRDSIQFGYGEFFGLMTSCVAPECKLHSEDFQVANYTNISAPPGTACFGTGGWTDKLFEGLADNGFEDCRDRCTQEPDCGYFTYWNDTMWCRLTTHCCFAEDNDPEVQMFAREPGDILFNRKVQTPMCPPPTPSPTAAQDSDNSQDILGALSDAGHLPYGTQLATTLLLFAFARIV